jgi:hypothetical protein
MQIKMDKTQQGITFAANLYSGSFNKGEDPIASNFIVKLADIQGLGTESSALIEPKDSNQVAIPYAQFGPGQFIDIQDDDFPPVRVCAGNIP